MREGTRVASIETGLAAAAAKLSQQVRKGDRLSCPRAPWPILGYLSWGCPRGTCSFYLPKATTRVVGMWQ